MIHEPWFSDWNYQVMQVLFRVVPHGKISDTIFDFLVFNHLVSTWSFAASFYVFWAIDDDRAMWRRGRLFQIVVAFGIAMLISLVIRPWIAWPPPVLNARFRGLYPAYFWSDGNFDSFPSHATLAYFMIAAGLWPLSRRASLWLVLAVLMLVSIPRIYVGGHYPIDVFASLVLVVAILALIWHWHVPASIGRWLVQTGPGALLRELLLILWVFELGEGFRGILTLVRHYPWH